MNKRVVLLNGPVNSGKGFIAQALVDRLGGVEQEFKEALYIATADLFKLDLEEFKALATDRVLKEQTKYWLHFTEYEKLCDFLGREYDDSESLLVKISPRDALIYTSEIVMKPQEGADYFGIKASEKMVEGNNYVSDSGFKEEAMVQVDTFGKENVLLVRIYRDDCAFSSQDSRSYINLDDVGIATLDLDNNRDINEVVKDIADFMYVNLVV